VAVQRGNAACIFGTEPSAADWDDIGFFSERCTIHFLFSSTYFELSASFNVIFEMIVL
jgi:hypothetical protein